MKDYKKFNTGIKFVPIGETIDLLRNGGALQLQDGYTDYEGVVTGKPGVYVRYIESIDDKGRPRARRYRFTSSLMRLMVRDNDADKEGISQYKFLKNHPDCEGSPYGKYDRNGVQLGAKFRELNEAQDAQNALKAEMEVTEAKTKALKLDEKTLAEVAAHIGHFGEPNEMMRLTVLEFATKRHYDFNEILKAGDREYRAAVRMGLERGVLKSKGSVIYWNDTVLGPDEDSVVARLISDKEMYDALLVQIDKPAQKKKVGNPNFGKKKVEI